MRLLLESSDDIVLAAHAARRRGNRHAHGLVPVLAQACRHGHLPLVKYFLEHPRCSTPLWSITRDTARGAISGAVHNNHLAVVEYLFEQGWRRRKGVDHSLVTAVRSFEVCGVVVLLALVAFGELRYGQFCLVLCCCRAELRSCARLVCVRAIATLTVARC